MKPQEDIHVEYIVASKISRSSLVYFTAIHLYNLQEMLQCIKKCTLTSFVALGVRSVGTSLKYGEPAFDFSFKTMLQHTVRFRSKNNVIKLELSQPSHDLVQMIFTFPSTDINIEGRTLL